MVETDRVIDFPIPPSEYPFLHGRITATNAIYHMLEGNMKFADPLLKHFFSCNWRESSEREQIANWRAIVFGHAIEARYFLKGQFVFIRTSSSRKGTIICLESEIDHIRQTQE